MPATPKPHKRKSTQYKPLTAMQEAYCQSYIKTPENQSQAAIDAGFSPNTAAVKASVMMRDERVQKRIAELMEERNKRNRVSADYVLMRLVEIDQMDVLDTRQTINSAYFVDLFMMLQNINTRSMPVEAVIEMKEEKLLMLGPVLERLNDEALNPLIDRVFSIMARKNMLPPPPEVMQGMPLRIEYISVMAQAQKSIGLTSLSQTVGFIGQLAQFKHEALDKLDVDQAIDAFSEMSGVSPTVIVPQEQVQGIREERAKQVQQAQAMQMGMAAAQGAKTLSETQTTDPSALTALTNAAGAAQQ